MLLRIGPTLAIVASALLFAAPAAFGATSSTLGYGGPGAGIQTQIDPAVAVAGVTDTGTPAGTAGVQGVNASRTTAAAGGAGDSSLPFTGLDLMLLAAGGLMLVGVGLGLRHTVRQPAREISS